MLRNCHTGHPSRLHPHTRNWGSKICLLLLSLRLTPTALTRVATVRYLLLRRYRRRSKNSSVC